MVNSHLFKQKTERQILTSVIIDTPETKPKLQNGQKVAFLFKETEVVITKGYISGISMQNKISGKIIEIQAAPILSKVSVQTALGPIQAYYYHSCSKAARFKSGR